MIDTLIDGDYERLISNPRVIVLIFLPEVVFAVIRIVS